MDGQGVEAAIFRPTLGVGMEQALIGDLPALTAAFRAFNRWLEEDWGFAYQERIFAAPYITLSDPAHAVSELQWALEHDARFVVMVGGPVMTERGSRAPADPMFDEFWRLANDSGITVLYHGAKAPTPSTSAPGARATSPRPSEPVPSAVWSRPTRC